MSYRLAPAILNAVNTGYNQGDQVRVRFFTTKKVVPFPKLPIQITQEEFQKTALEVDAISKKAILEKQIIEKMKEPFSLDLEKADSPIYRTGSFYSWTKANVKKANIQEDGSITLLNSDKRVLITQFACLVEKGVIMPEKQILLLNEGCDNGDFLGLMIPFLLEHGSELKVVLVNGNEKKLKEAAMLTKFLVEDVGDKNVTYLIHDSFASIPAIVSRNFSDHQTFHLFFRLPIVERFSVVADFTEKRLASMKPSDIAIGSFLLWNKISMDTMLSKQSQVKEENSNLGYVTLEQNMTKSAKNILSNSGTSEEDLGVYTTAFTEKGVQDLIAGCGGDILHLAKIPTKTDDGGNIDVIGVIFRKSSVVQ